MNQLEVTNNLFKWSPFRISFPQKLWKHRIPADPFNEPTGQWPQNRSFWHPMTFQPWNFFWIIQEPIWNAKIWWQWLDFLNLLLGSPIGAPLNSTNTTRSSRCHSRRLATIQYLMSAAISSEIHGLQYLPKYPTLRIQVCPEISGLHLKSYSFRMGFGTRTILL